MATSTHERGFLGYALHELGEIAAHGEHPDVDRAESQYRSLRSLRSWGCARSRPTPT